MMLTRKNLFCLLTLFILTLPVAGLAQVVGSGFDGMAPGAYIGAGSIIQGDPDVVQVVPVEDLGSAAPPNAFGNVLCIDNRGTNTAIIMRFNYSCGGPLPDGICVVEYDFFFASWQIGAYIGVYTDDDGSYTNPDDWFQPPVGFPPSTAWGDNAEGESDCLAGHTIDFIVSPGAVAYLDNFTTLCIPPVANELETWGSIKSMYR